VVLDLVRTPSEVRAVRAIISALRRWTKEIEDQNEYPMDIQDDRPFVTSLPRRMTTSPPRNQPEPIFMPMSPIRISPPETIHNDMVPMRPSPVNHQSSQALDRFVTAGTRNYTLHYVVTIPRPAISSTETKGPRALTSVDRAVHTEPDSSTGTLHYVTPTEGYPPVPGSIVPAMSNPPPPTLASCFAPCLSAFHRPSNSYLPAAPPPSPTYLGHIPPPQEQHQQNQLQPPDTPVLG